MRLKGPVELNVTADSSMMLIIRLTTAGVLTRAGLTMDAMDNLKMAAEEACNCLIGQENPPESIRLRFDCVEDGLNIHVSAQNSEPRQGSADETELEVIRCILASLADDVSLDVQDGWIHAVELRTALA